MNKTPPIEGRKFRAMKYAVALLLVILAMLYSLAFLERAIPAAFTVIASTLATCLPIYLGANLYQKKLETEEKKEGV